jgi:hypothetical protein
MKETSLSDQNTKEMNKMKEQMEEQYEIPKLVLVGRADEVVLGHPGLGPDGAFGSVINDFEYQQD